MQGTALTRTSSGKEQQRELRDRETINWTSDKTLSGSNDLLPIIWNAVTFKKIILSADAITRDKMHFRQIVF